MGFGRMGWWWWLGLLALGCSRKSEPPGRLEAASTQVAPAPSLAGRTTELFTWGGIPPALAPQPASADLAAPLLAVLFPRSLPSVDRCPDQVASAAQARAEGWLVPRVAHQASGSFSGPGLREQLVDVRVGECGATHAEGWGSRRLVLWADGRVRLDVEAPGRLAGVVDLEGDGVSEILLENGGTAQGLTTSRLKVARIEGQGVKILADLGVVYEGNCGAQTPEDEEVSLVKAIARPGLPLDFELQKDRRPCR
jgi:hypothetical protein